MLRQVQGKVQADTTYRVKKQIDLRVDFKYCLNTILGYFTIFLRWNIIVIIKFKGPYNVAALLASPMAA